MAITSLGFTILTAFTIKSSMKDENYDYPYADSFGQHFQLANMIIAYSYLTMFAVMLLLNGFLIHYNKSSLSKLSQSTMYQTSFKRENCILVITCSLFGLSYGLRFVWDIYLDDHLYREGADGEFLSDFFYNLLCLVEGITLLPLLLVHHKNFKVHQPVEVNEEQEPSSRNYSSSVND